MTPLLDADVLLYELGFAAEYKREEPASWESVQEMADLRIKQICEAVGATCPPLLYLTGKGNFREEIAQRKGYKTNRNKDKPFHYHNLKAYFKHTYGAVEVDGMEADDAMAIYQTYKETSDLPDDITCICSRDKDLRQVPGWHYSWECGKQGEKPLYLVDELGEFWTEKLPKELKGTGLRFFYAQCLMGDSVDNIPGLPGIGPKGAYELLRECPDRGALELAVRTKYRDHYGDSGDAEFLEQAQLLWLVRELDEEGKPVMFQLINYT